MNKQQIRKGAAYIRYSNSQQDNNSVEIQLQVIKEYAKENNINIVFVYQDLGETGTKVDRRIEFKKMIKDSALGLFEIVLCHKIDRFARNTMDFLNYEKQLLDNGVELVAVDQPFGDSPAEKVARTLMISMAQMFSENLSSEVKVKMMEYARKGQHCGGVCPFGYNVVDKRYVINPTESITVRRVFELYDMGYGQYKIVRILTEEGHRTRNGNKFSTQTVKDILVNPIHKGEYRYNVSEGERYKKEGVDNSIIIPDNHEAIVPKELWNRVNAKLVQRHTEVRKKWHTYGRVYILTGLMKCGVCGGSFSGIRGNRKASYYLCGHIRRKVDFCSNGKAVRREYFDDFILDYIEKEFLSKDNIHTLAHLIVDNIVHEDKDVTETIADLNRNIKKMQNRSSRLRNLYLDGDISQEEYEESKKEIKESIDFYETELFKINVNQTKIETKDIINFLTEIKKNFKTQDKEFLKVLLSKIISSIVVYEDKIDIYLNAFNPYPDDAGINIDVDLPKVSDSLPLFTLGKSKVHRLDSGVVVAHFSFDRDIFTYQYQVQNKKEK